MALPSETTLLLGLVLALKYTQLIDWSEHSFSGVGMWLQLKLSVSVTTRNTFDMYLEGEPALPTSGT